MVVYVLCFRGVVVLYVVCVCVLVVVFVFAFVVVLCVFVVLCVCDVLYEVCHEIRMNGVVLAPHPQTTQSVN